MRIKTRRKMTVRNERYVGPKKKPMPPPPRVGKKKKKGAEASAKLPTGISII